MSRTITVDTSNVIWYGTDNGIIRIENGEMSLINSTNSLLVANKNNHTTIMHAAADRNNNKWFCDFKRIYKYDDQVLGAFKHTHI